MARKPKHRPSFFKVLIGDFANRLRIPPAFVRNFKGDVPEDAVIRDDASGDSWAVKIEQIGGNHFFTHRGWRNCALDNRFQCGDFVIFLQNSHNVFEIVSYDPTGCEKEPKPPADSDFEAERNAFERNREDQSRVRTSRRRLQKSNRSPAGKPIDFNFGAEHPCFLIAAFKEHHRPFVTVPRTFAAETGLASKKSVVLRNEEGDVWTVQLAVRGASSYGRLDMSVGWRDFWKDNEIEKGDTCLFKFVQVAGNADEIHVRVVHKAY